MRSMLAIPRPRTRGDCLQEARPCPWVGCRQHLLLEVAKPTRRQDSAARAPGLILNVPTANGRRRHLPSSCAAEVVRVWIDEALELLSTMPYTCTLDRADEGPARMREVAKRIGTSRTQAKQERRRAIAKAAAAVAAMRDRKDD